MHIYKTSTPCTYMTDYIESFWTFSYEQHKPQVYSILPDGNFDLMYIFKDNKLINIRLTGLWEKKVDITYNQPVKVFGIRFKPAASTTIFKFPLNEIVNSALLLNNDDMIPSIDQITNIVPYSTEDVIQFFQDYYAKIIKKNINVGETALFKLIENSRGLQSVDSLASKYGISNRQLCRRVNKVIGVSPKSYLNILRFRQYCENINIDAYYDQSHLIKNFHHLCDETPERIKNKQDVRFLQYKAFLCN